MITRILSLCVAAALILPAAAQAPEGYLDILIFKVKPEKRAEFDGFMKRIAAANQRFNGDRWLAAESQYGEWNTIYITSPRASHDEAEKSSEVFLGALMKAFGGPAAAEKVFAVFNNSVVSARAELRLRRMDLSRNPPASAAAQNKLIGESRWYRTTTVRVRPGRADEFAALIRANNATLDKSGSSLTYFVAQGASGQAGNTFYFTTLHQSLKELDSAPSLRQGLGEAGYQKYQAVVREIVLSTETMVNRFLPELSNPPEEVVTVAPEYWRPKPPPPPPPKKKQ